MATETITVNVGGQPALAVAVEVEQVSGTAPPDFVATMRGLSPGDDAPIDSYATDLDGYVADIDEAQDLLDAAQAVGTPAAAIAKLAAADITTYTDLADVIAAALPEGTPWRILWGAGTLAAPFDGAGEIVGTILNGDPSWIGFLPSDLWGTTLSDTTATGGTRTTDSDGRPRLSVTSTSGSSVETDLGMRTDRPQRVRLLARLTVATPADVAADVGGLRLKRVSGGNNLDEYIGYFTGAGGWIVGLRGSAVINFQNTATPLDTTKFSSGRQIEFEVQFIAGNSDSNALLDGSNLIASDTRKLHGNTVSSHLGSGGSANDMDPRAYLVSVGAAMTLDLLGIQISGPPTRG